LIAFLSIIGAFYILTYILTLAKTSYSLFSYTEMNGVLYTFTNFLLLAPILPLSSLLLVESYTNIKAGVPGGGGLVVGLFSMGCPSCGALLLSFVGVTAGLASFPLNGLELKLFSVGLLGFATYKLRKSKTCSVCYTEPAVKVKPFFSRKFENIMLAVIVATAALVLFNQIQISSVSASLSGLNGAASTVFFSSTADLSGADTSQVSSTAMAIATVFPELKKAKNEQDVMNIMLPTGTPEYSEALGGITFDDPVTSLDYLARWYYTLKEEIKQNNPEVWQRYLALAAAPRGISCEFCCGVGPQGIDAEGNLRCGCKHNPAAQAVALGLMKNTDYSDAQVLREVMRWKTIFFPRNMVALGVQVAGQDASQLKDLPGMVGGC
jgi:hypothetical protein